MTTPRFKSIVMTVAAMTGVAAFVLPARVGARRQDGRLLQVYVAALAPAGHVVTDLRPEELDVRVDGQPSQIRAFDAGPRAASVVILFDVSGSLAYASGPESIVRFVEPVLGPDDRVSVAPFGPAIARASPFTRDQTTLRQLARDALRDRVPLGGPSPVWDSVNAAVTALEGERNRRAVVLVTDGKATGDLTSFAAVVRHTLIANVEVIAVVAGMPSPAAAPAGRAGPRAAGRGRAGASPVRLFMPPWERPAQMADLSGGLSIAPSDDTGDLRDRLGRAIEALHHEVVLTVAAPDEAGQAHRIEVAVHRPGLTVRARKTYE
jgi:VWFA-related protein